MEIKDLVKDNIAEFSYFREGRMYYNIKNPQNEIIALFYVDVYDKEDVGNATFNNQEKAIIMMRYIRKCKEKGELVVY